MSNPDRVEFFLFGVFIARGAQVHLVTAGLDAKTVRGDRGSNKMLHCAEDFVGGTNTDGAGQLGRAIVYVKGLCGDVLAKLFAPDFGVTGAATFEQHH